MDLLPYDPLQLVPEATRRSVLRVRCPKKRGLSRALGHVRDSLLSWAPLEMETPAGRRVPVKSRAELRLYKEICVRRNYPVWKLAARVRLEPGVRIIDAGANVGFFAIAALDVWPEGEVHAFEPAERSCERIRALVDANKLQSQIIVNQGALGSSTGEIEFFENRNSESSSTVREKADRRKIVASTKVRVWTLDDYLASLAGERDVILKIDVEGAELDVLEGAAQSLDRVKILFIEIHPPFADYRAVNAQLAARGFRCVFSSKGIEDVTKTDCIFLREGDLDEDGPQ